MTSPPSGWPPTLPRDVRDALDTPEVTCAVDVSVRRDDTRQGWLQVHTRQGVRRGVVAAVSSAGGGAEITWWRVEEWQTQLTRAATVPVPDSTEPPPAPGIEIPLDVLLGAGEAIRTNRADVLDELVRRAVGVSRTATGELEAGELRTQLALLHRGVLGRLLATVAAREGPGGMRVGWVSWLMFADGWRALTPTRVEGRPSVRVDLVEPPGLGAEVARLVAVVRGRP